MDPGLYADASGIDAKDGGEGVLAGQLRAPPRPPVAAADKELGTQLLPSTQGTTQQEGGSNAGVERGAPAAPATGQRAQDVGNGLAGVPPVTVPATQFTTPACPQPTVDQLLAALIAGGHFTPAQLQALMEQAVAGQGSS